MIRLDTKQSPHRFATIRGFTLQEMLVTLCISGALAGGSAGMWNVVQQNAITAAANDLVTHLALARNEAITKNKRITVCPTGDQKSCLGADNDFTNWQSGWMVYVDENDNGKPDDGEIVRVQSEPTRGITIRSSRARSHVAYQPTGLSGGSTITMAICSERDPSLARYVIVSNVGRARVAQTTTSNLKCR